MRDPLHAAGTKVLSVPHRRPERTMMRYRLRVHVDGQNPEVVQTLAAPTVRIGSRPGNDVVVPDPSVSGAHVEITADAHGFRLRDLGSTNGTWVDGYRVVELYLRPGSVIRMGKSEIVFDPIASEVVIPSANGEQFGPLRGQSVPMRELFATLATVAQSGATVLIQGETGTGKELVARAIHAHSPRADKPFVVLDCAAVTENLLESELFGHEKGAFTGATERRIGRLEEAHGGTLFIDELGDLPLSLQPKLLRALERREVRRLGASKFIAVDLRVVAATHHDLARDVNQGLFREDLYYRLAVVRVDVPPLRERKEDIPLLVEHFIQAATHGKRDSAKSAMAAIGPQNWRALEEHSWPGNVRELKNLIERTLAVGSPGEFATGVSHKGAARLSREGQGQRSRTELMLEFDLGEPFAEQKNDALAQFERRYLHAQLDRFSGNISRAAAASGLDRMYFKRLLRKYP